MSDNLTDTNTGDRRALLRNALEALEKMQRKLEAVQQARREPIAVVGMSCRLPGGVATPEDYWDLLSRGGDAIQRVPADRWDASQYYDADPSAPGRIHAPFGGFLDNIDEFDAGFFGISRREAESMDPQQRLLLEVSWEAIERAGIDASRLRGSKTGVFVGVTTTDYSRLLLGQDPALLDAYTATGTALNVAAGRLAFFFGLNGPAMAIDTACSSSLVAIHLACQSLRSGEADMALAGGVNVLLSPEPFICFAKWGMMAPDGRCKTFDEAADGFVRGEGCGMLVLKRLSDAVSSGDLILAVIRGSAVNQDGASSGLTVPNGLAQQVVVSEALKAADMSPQEISYVEAHGTGTRLGDPIELEALAKVLGPGRTSDNPLRVGAVKTNIGHLESASGVAGLMKVILALNHKTIPPHLHFRKLNPQTHLGDMPLEICTEPTPWSRNAGTLAAGVSSFGFSGTNAHIVVTEAREPEVRGVQDRSCEAICLAARSRSALEQKVRDFIGFLDKEPDSSLADISWSVTAGRKHFPHRLALAAEDRGSVRDKLTGWLEGKHPDAVFYKESSGGQAKRAAFLFTGQGAQYAGMGKSLYETQPVFHDAIDRCAGILERFLDRPLQTILFAEGSHVRQIDETLYAQPALFAVEYALVEMLRAWGIEPAMVMGHSVGEYLAAWVAGVFSLEDGLRLVTTRSRLVAQKTERGTMAAVYAGIEVIMPAIAPFAAEISIAAVNGPQNVVISGRSSTMEGVLAGLAEQDIRYRRLSVSHAFHSPLMDPVLDAFYKAASDLDFSSPLIPMISNIDSKRLPPGAVPDAAYWRRHMRAPVQFDASIHALAGEACECWLEIGPNPTLLAMARQLEPGIEADLLPTLRRDQPDWTQLTEAMVALYVRGWNIDWQSFHAGRPRRPVQLPTYPFEREAFWVDVQERAPKPDSLLEQKKRHAHPLLGFRMDLPGQAGVIVWESTLDIKSCSFLLDHRVQETAIMPATGYLEMALSAAAELKNDEVFVLRDVSFHKPLRLDETVQPVLQLWMRQGENGSFGVQVFSRMAAPDVAEVESRHWTLHMSGTLVGSEEVTSDRAGMKMDLDNLRSRCTEEISGTDFYATQNGRGNQWGLCFQGVEALWCGDGEALSRVYIPLELMAGLDDYRMHPAVADFCGHVLVATLPTPSSGLWRHHPTVDSLSEFRVYGPLRSRKLWAHAQLPRDGQKAENVLKGDVRVFDENGVLLAESLGMQLGCIENNPPTEAGIVRSWMYEVCWVPQTVNVTESASDLHGCNWAVFADVQGIGDELCGQIEACGGTCVRVLPGKQFGQDSELQWRVRPDNPLDFQRCLKGICKDSEGLLSKVVYLWNLDAPKTDELTADNLRQWQLLGCGSLLHLVQALNQIEEAKTVKVYLVTAGAQFSLNQVASFSLAQVPLWGLGRTVAAEHTQLWGGLLDLDPAESPQNCARQLLKSISTGGAEDQMMFRKGNPLVARLQPLKIPIPDSDLRPLTIRRDGSYLITGGVGGIGCETARWLGRNGARHVILIGRTPLPDRESWDQARPGTLLSRRIERIRSLEHTGLEVEYLSNDAGDKKVYEELHLRISQGRIPEVRGIVHAAGVMQYEALLGQSAARMFEVMQAKVIGGWLLHKEFLNQALDFFILFSSASSLLDSPFMGAYSAANTFLDALARYRRLIGLPALSVSWGTWSQTGMAVDLAQAESRSALKGVGTISNREGIEALELLLKSNTVHAGVMPIDWELWRRTYPVFSSTPYLEKLMGGMKTVHLVGEIEDRGKTAGTVTTGITLLERLQRASAGEQKDILFACVRDNVVKVLKIDTAQPPNIHQVFSEIGMDSLMAVELNNRLQIDLGHLLPPTLAFEYPTIDSLTAYLFDKLFSSTKNPMSFSRARKGGNSENSGTQELEQLTEQEAERALLGELEKSGY